MLHNFPFRSSSLLAIFFGLLLAGVAPVQAQDEEAQIRQLLLQRDRQIKQVLGEGSSLTADQRAQLKDLINDLIDFRAMSRRTLGSFWGDLSANEQAEFVDVFSSIVREHSLSDLDAYRAEVSVETITVEGDKAHVVTHTVYEGQPVKVEYDLIAQEDGAWRASDIIIDGVSTVKGYQRSFQQVIRQHGFDALMESLHEKVQEITSS